MAVLEDKFYNRKINGKLQVNSDDEIAPEAVGKAISGGNVNNAKPLYFHPITVAQRESTSNAKYVFTLIIIDNNPARYDTWEKLSNKLKSIQSNIGNVARFPASGSFVPAGSEVSVPCYGLECSSQSSIVLYGDYAGVVYNVQLLTYPPITVLDGVNKIN